MPSDHRYLNKAQQHPGELQEFIAFIAKIYPSSFLEIGSKFGGVLWAVSNVMQKKSRIVSVDLPNGLWGRSDSEPSLKICVQKLKARGFDTHLFVGDSTDPQIIEKVKALGPFDCLFIDANHTESFVRKDFANYGRLAKHCCFHDIFWNNPTPPRRYPIEVPKVWAEIKTKHAAEGSFREIRHEERHNGIGIISWN